MPDTLLPGLPFDDGAVLSIILRIQLSPDPVSLLLELKYPFVILFIFRGQFFKKEVLF